MKLKLDEQGQVVVQDGKPVYVQDDGSEVAFDAADALGKVRKFSADLDALRTRAVSAEQKLEAFADLDPALARKALKTVGDLDAKKLIDAGKVDEVREETKRSFEGQLTELKTQLEKSAATVAERDAAIFTLKVSNEIASDPWLKESKLLLPPDVVIDLYANSRYFKQEDGRIVPYLNGQKLYSKDPQRAGELASPREAIRQIIDARPDAKSLFGASKAAGSEARPGEEPSGDGRTVSIRNQQGMSSAIEDIASGKVQVVQ